MHQLGFCCAVSTMNHVRQPALINKKDIWILLCQVSIVTVCSYIRRVCIFNLPGGGYWEPDSILADFGIVLQDQFG